MLDRFVCSSLYVEYAVQVFNFQGHTCKCFSIQGQRQKNSAKTAQSNEQDNRRQYLPDKLEELITESFHDNSD